MIDEDEYIEWLGAYLENTVPPSPTLPSYFIQREEKEEKFINSETLKFEVEALSKNLESFNTSEIDQLLKRTSEILNQINTLEKKEKKTKGRKPTTSLKIIKTLQAYPGGLSFSELYTITKISKPTLKKLLNILKKEGKIKYEKYEGGRYMVMDEKKVDEMNKNIKDIKDIVSEIRSLVVQILEYYKKKEESMYIKRPEVTIDPTKIQH